MIHAYYTLILLPYHVSRDIYICNALVMWRKHVWWLYTGQLDTPLSDKGRQQAKLLGKRLSSQEFTHVYSSDLIRSHEVSMLL